MTERRDSPGAPGLRPGEPGGTGAATEERRKVAVAGGVCMSYISHVGWRLAPMLFAVTVFIFFNGFFFVCVCAFPLNIGPTKALRVRGVCGVRGGSRCSSVSLLLFFFSPLFAASNYYIYIYIKKGCGDSEPASLLSPLEIGLSPLEIALFPLEIALGGDEKPDRVSVMWERGAGGRLSAGEPKMGSAQRLPSLLHLYGVERPRLAPPTQQMRRGRVCFPGESSSPHPRGRGTYGDPY